MNPKGGGGGHGRGRKPSPEPTPHASGKQRQLVPSAAFERGRPNSLRFITHTGPDATIRPVKRWSEPPQLCHHCPLPASPPPSSPSASLADSLSDSVSGSSAAHVPFRLASLRTLLLCSLTASRWNERRAAVRVPSSTGFKGTILRGGPTREARRGSNLQSGGASVSARVRVRECELERNLLCPVAVNRAYELTVSEKLPTDDVQGAKETRGTECQQHNGTVARRSGGVEPTCRSKICAGVVRLVFS